MKYKGTLIVVKDCHRALQFYHDLYFEEPDIEGFIERLEALYPKTEYVNRLLTHSWGQKVVRFYDPDGNLIEVGTPV